MGYVTVYLFSRLLLVVKLKALMMMMMLTLKLGDCAGYGQCCLAIMVKRVEGSKVGFMRYDNVAKCHLCKTSHEQRDREHNETQSNSI